jgi:hypothetical protein
MGRTAGVRHKQRISEEVGRILGRMKVGILEYMTKTLAILVAHFRDG